MVNEKEEQEDQLCFYNNAHYLSLSPYYGGGERGRICAVPGACETQDCEWADFYYKLFIQKSLFMRNS